jgi:hypothetical protein
MASQLRRGALVGLLGLVGVLCSTSALAAPSVAPRYLIVPNHSVGKVVIGEGAGPVVGAIGAPHGRGEDAGPQWLYGALDVEMNTEQIQVVALIVAPVFGASESEAAQYQTRAGIHVGSTLGAVEKAYPKARCSVARRGCVLTSGTLSTLFGVPVSKGQGSLSRASAINQIAIGSAD